MKNNLNLLFIGITILLASCAKDLGNYEYKETNDVTIENIPDVFNVLASVDTLKIFPKITTKADGIITEENSNYSFVYALDGFIEDKTMHYKALDSSYPMNLEYFVDLAPGDYSLRFAVTDKRTGIQTTKKFMLKVGTAVTEGWMVLGNEGPERRLRMDMISVISEDRIAQAFDLLPALGMPELHHAYQIKYIRRNPINAAMGVITENEGGYRMEEFDLSSGPAYNMVYDFGDLKSNLKPVAIDGLDSYHLTVDKNNNAYALYYWRAGPIFEFPINTTTNNRKPEFRVSKYFAVDKRVSGSSNSALFYDIDNKRFIDWSGGRSTISLPLTNPAQPLFDYTTGKEMVYMESSLHGNSTAYTILKKDGQYSLYGITFVPASPVGRFEQSYYADLNIPDIENATSFAFHSNLPYMFYAAGAKVYQYDLASKTAKVMLTLENENVTMLKFNIFRFNYPNKTQEYLDQQFDLIVGTTDSRLPEKSNGILRFYDVPPLNGDLTLSKPVYKGFAEIVDVVYKESR